VIGPFINSAALAAGAGGGATLGSRVSEEFRNKMTLVFGLISMALGLAMVPRVKFLPAVMLSIILGTLIGELVRLETGISALAGKARGLIDRIARPAAGGLSEAEFLNKYVAIIVLFCASGTGVFGAMNEGMTGDSSLLVVKSILDVFTALFFATVLGYSVVLIAIPQLLIQAVLFLLAHRIMPLTTPMMIADFSACGGVLMLATGLRITGIKNFSIANMLPAMFLAMPLSAFWARHLAH
jgi:uncharacterized membrane protein YqgA involved in biofilm formation